MSFILNIDTYGDIASVCVAHNGEALYFDNNNNQRDHAIWLHTAIDTMFKKNNRALKDISAVALTIGPGSYTGLRVGLATAKGVCYALQVPLITINTLELMALAVQNEASDLICPMIDARRMEVFTAIYNKNLQPILISQAMVINETSFKETLATHQILFCGNGSKKLQSIIKDDNALFSTTIADASHLASLSYERFCKKEFADLAYTEPLYIKEFYTPIRK